MSEFTKYVVGLDNRINYHDNDFIVVWQGRAFEIDGTLTVHEITDFAAIGAGSDFALAALHLGKTATEACEVACKLSVMCELPVVTMFDKEGQ